MATSTLLRGTMLLTAGIFISKFLGMLYVIPFQWLVGEAGAALYLYAYNPYNILLSISIIGVPKAVAKFVAKYNSLGDYETGRRMFKHGIILMTGTGFIGFLLLFFGAEFLAKGMISTEDATGSTVEDIKLVIQMVSFALIIIPSMSIVRGFFQGYESMGPTALSQLVEQIARIIFLLVATYLVIKVFNGSVSLAVGYATFATFIGAVASTVVLFFYWRKRKPYLDEKLQLQTTSYNLPMPSLYKELFRYAGPFVLVGTATSMYQIVDQFTFNKAMVSIGYAQETAEAALSSFNLLSHKLVSIPVTLAMALSLAMLPAITRSFTTNKKEEMANQINQSFQIIMLFILPSVVGLIILSKEAYGALFGIDHIELYGSLLAWYAPVGIFFSLFTVSSNVLQGIDKQNFTVISLAVGVLLKIVLNVPFIHIFDAKGAIIATLVAVAAVVILNLWKISHSLKFSYRKLFKQSLLVSIFTTIMGIVVWLVKWLMGFFISYVDGSLQAAAVLIVGVSVGAVVFLYLSYMSKLLEYTLGSRVRVLDKFFKKKGKPLEG